MHTNKNISDFKIAEKYLRNLCDKYGDQFVDLPVVFGDHPVALEGKRIYVGNPKNLAHAIYNIISVYIINFNALHSTCFSCCEISNMIITASSVLKKLFYDRMTNETAEDALVTKLYANKLLWIYVKDLIAPIFECKVSNIKIIKVNDPDVDVSTYLTSCEAEEATGGKIKEDIILENIGLENEIVRYAFVLVSVIKSLNLSPHIVMSKIRQDFKDEFLGLAQLYFKDVDAAKYFMLTILQLLDLNTQGFEGVTIKSAQSGAQSMGTQAYPPMQMWNLPLIEALLEPVRGPDIQLHDELEKKLRSFWDDVEQIKQTRYGKGDAVPFNVLLQLKSKDLKTDTTRTLQSLLSSARVW